MRILSMVLTFMVAIFFITACGPETISFEDSRNAMEPDQNALFVFASDEYPIACFYFDPSRKDYGQGLPIFNQAWVWAKTAKHSNVIAEGPREDGFVVAKSIRGWNLLKGLSNETVASTQDDLENICQTSINEAHPKKNLRLYQISAFKSYVQHSKYPVVVGENKSPNQITRMIIFGDSLSDTGKLKGRLQIFPERPYFLGRFSNGPIWNDSLAKMANLAIRNPSRGGAVTAPNINYSVKEIITLVRDLGRTLITGSINKFIDDYLNKHTAKGKITNVDKTLFVIWAGANDYLAKFDAKQDLTDLLDRQDLEKKGSNYIAKFSVENIANAVKQLYYAGGRKFVVGNLPDIGLTPAMGVNKNYRKDDAISNNLRNYLFATKTSQVMRTHNDLLATRIENLRNELPDATIILFDAYRALNNLVEGVGPKGEKNFDYGINISASFTTLSASGKPTIPIGKMCFEGDYLGSKDDRLICDNANEVLFWDDVHPTSVGHCGIGFLMHDTLYENNLVSIKPDYSEYRKTCGP